MHRCPLIIGTVLFCLADARANVFTVSNINDIGPGSLHDALLEANANPGPDEIHFNIPGAGVQQIAINRVPLPEITDPVTIDGYTQPGAAPNALTIGNNAIILIHLDGKNDWSGPVNGVVISAGNSIIRGLSITGVPARVYIGIPEDPPPPPPEGDAIQLKTRGGNVIEGNFIGLLPSGEAAGSYYTYRGVEVLSENNRIGGPTPGSRNVISRQYKSIVAQGNGAIIEGNYLGSDPGGFSARGNSEGVVVLRANVRIGGTTPGAGNLISASQIGITVSGLARDTIIQGNLIGTTADGSGFLPSSYSVAGISIYGARTLVGGLESGAGNRFSWGSRAVWITGNDAVGNTILSNIFNAGYREGIIELGAFRNDLGDSDTGPNNLQNFPIITSVTRSSDSTRVIGGLNSVASTAFTLQFFVKRLSSTGNPLLGTENVTTDESGMAHFDFTFPGSVAANETISATATDAAGNTSQFFPANGRVQLANIATRGSVGAGDQALIGGLVVHRPLGFIGAFQKKVLIRALGPSLSGAGLPAHECLADPYLEMRDNSGALIAQNDDWRSNQSQEIIASGLQPPSDLESAAVVSLGDGAYTVQVRGANNSLGLGTVEVFDLDPLDPLDRPGGSGRLVNISTRGRVGTGNDVLIGGFIVNGDAGEKLVIRATGPDLTAVGVPDALSDPTLELRDATGTLMASNDNWRDVQEQEIQQTAFAPSDNRDSAILVSLIPGNYTAIVRGKDSTAGIALVEVYSLSH